MIIFIMLFAVACHFSKSTELKTKKTSGTILPEHMPNQNAVKATTKFFLASKVKTSAVFTILGREFLFTHHIHFQNFSTLIMCYYNITNIILICHNCSKIIFTKALLINFTDTTW